jgi:flagellar basal-body rod protein FlgF
VAARHISRTAVEQNKRRSIKWWQGENGAMLYGIYQSAGGLQLNQYRQDVLANNLANVQTSGFKHDVTMVTERQVASQEPGGDPWMSNQMLDQLTGGSLVAPTHTVFEQGPLEKTGQPLDLALVGDGFFAVQKDGQEHYTRDGKFTINPDGSLVTVAGNHPVLDKQGNTITVPKELTGQVEFGADGVLRAGRQEFGQLRVVDFENKQHLRKVGQNVFQAIDAQPVESNASLRVGMSEKSTVDSMKSMVSMLEVTRAYQMNSTLIGLADSTLGRAVNDIARIH